MNEKQITATNILLFVAGLEADIAELSKGLGITVRLVVEK
jgi:hypothetical protein